VFAKGRLSVADVAAVKVLASVEGAMDWATPSGEVDAFDI
jgi:hypothetical protein